MLGSSAETREELGRTVSSMAVVLTVLKPPSPRPFNKPIYQEGIYA
ncbi:hypothetical protein SALBM311S_06602 [Streptomyces alboniger]